MLTTYPFSFPSPFITTTEDLFPAFSLLDHHPTTFRIARHRRWGAQFPTAPRFDVRERTAAFELQGEIPGLRQQDVVIEFVDPHTLVIRGRVEREETDVENPDVKGKGKEVEGTAPRTADVDRNTKSQQATVEDEGQASPAIDDDNSTTTSTTTIGGANTPTSSAAEQETTTTVASATATANANLSSESKYKYWVNERAVIEQFERRFKFPGDVDQEAVKASLRNGILSVVVPKVVKAVKEGKRIVVEG